MLGCLNSRYSRPRFAIRSPLSSLVSKRNSWTTCTLSLQFSYEYYRHILSTLRKPPKYKKQMLSCTGNIVWADI